MSWRVSFWVAAEDDLAEARAWYEAKREGLGEDFTRAIVEAIARLEDNPFQFPLYHRDYRRVVTHRFPYKLFFRVEGEEVVIIRILHSSRDHTRELW